MSLDFLDQELLSLLRQNHFLCRILHAWLFLDLNAWRENGLLAVWLLLGVGLAVGLLGRFGFLCEDAVGAPLRPMVPARSAPRRSEADAPPTTEVLASSTQLVLASSVQRVQSKRLVRFCTFLFWLSTAGAAMLAARDVSDARSSSTTRRCGDQHLARCDEDSRTAIGGALLPRTSFLFYYNM